VPLTQAPEATSRYNYLSLGNFTSQCLGTKQTGCHPGQI